MESILHVIYIFKVANSSSKLDAPILNVFLLGQLSPIMLCASK